MATNFKNIKRPHNVDHKECGMSHSSTVSEVATELFLKSKIKKDLNSKRKKLEDAKKSRTSNPPYISYSNLRDDPYTYLPVIFHVFEPNPELGMSEYFPDIEAEKVISLVNEMLRGEVDSSRAIYINKYSAYAGTLTDNWQTNYENSKVLATFTKAIEHPDHGVEANFRFKIPNKLRIDDLIATGLFDEEQLLNFNLVGDYIYGGPQGVIFRYPYDVWTLIPELSQIANGANPTVSHPLFDAIPAFNVVITDIAATNVNYGGIAVFPTSACNFHCNLNGANMHHRLFTLAEVLLHELGHTLLIKHTHGNVPLKNQDGALYVGENLLSETAESNLSPGVGYNPPRYLNQNNESVYDLDPLDNKDKQYIEFIFTEVSKLFYSFYPSIEKEFFSNYSDYYNYIENRNEYYFNYYSPFNYPNGYYEAVGPSFTLPNTTLAHYGLAAATSNHGYTSLYSKIGGMSVTHAVTGFPYWGGSQAYDSQLDKNVLVLNPVGPSENIVGNVYDVDSGVATASSAITIDVNPYGGTIFDYNSETGVGYVFADDALYNMTHPQGVSGVVSIFSSGGFTDWSSATLDQLIQIAENPNVVQQRAFLETNKIWASDVASNGAYIAMFMHPPIDGFQPPAGQPNSYGTYNAFQPSSQFAHLPVRQFVDTTLTVRRGPTLNGEGINRIPFCKLDSNGNQTNNYDPLWNVYKNQFNPAYPPYPDNYPVKDWTNLPASLCPCLSAEQGLKDEADNTIYYYPKTVSDEVLKTAFLMEYVNKHGISYGEAVDIFYEGPLFQANGDLAKLMGSLNPVSLTSQKWVFEGNTDEALPVGIFYYGFDVSHPPKGYKYQSNSDLSIILPNVSSAQELPLYNGALFYETGMKDLRRSSPLQANVLSSTSYHHPDLDMILSFANEDFIIGPYIDHKGNSVTINLKNPLKEHYNINLASLDKDEVQTAFQNTGDPGLPFGDTNHVIYNELGYIKPETYGHLHWLYEDPDTYFTYQSNSMLTSFQNFALSKFRTVSSCADGLFHPDGPLNGVKLGTDDIKGITYRDLTNLMQYPFQIDHGALDNVSTSTWNADLSKYLQAPLSVDTYIEAVCKLHISIAIEKRIYSKFFEQVRALQANYTIGNDFELSQQYYNRYGEGDAYDIRFSMENGHYYSFLPRSEFNYSRLTNGGQSLQYGDLIAATRTGFRCTFSPEQIFFIEAYIEYCTQVTYAEIDTFLGLFTQFEAGGISPETLVDGMLQTYADADSMYYAAKGLKDILTYASDISLRPSSSYSSVNQINQLISGTTIVKNLCDGVVETTYVDSAINIPNSSLSRQTGVPVSDAVMSKGRRDRERPVNTNTNNAVELSNLYTYGHELYRLDGTEYKGYYHVHSTLGPMEGAEHSEESHGRLKYYYHLDKNGNTYKNKTRRANNFHKIYRSIFKIS